MINIVLQIGSTTSVFPKSLNMCIRGRSECVTRDGLILSEFDRRQLKIETELAFREDYN